MTTKICPIDGTKFTPKRATGVYCSDKCRKTAARAAGADPVTGEVVASMTPKAPTKAAPVVVENPFDRPAPDGYDPEKALAAFKKMGLEEVRWIETGIPAFDTLTKIPRGRVTQIQGPYAVGKTTLALNMIAGLRGRKVFYIDSEASLNPSLLVRLRLDDGNFTLWNKSAFLEDMYDALLEAATSGKYDLIVLDSLASCTTKTEAEGDITASNIGQKAKMVNKMMRIIPSLLKEHDTALVIINQEREMIGGYVPVKYTPGGMGVPYAASLMISLKTIKSWRFGRTATDTKQGKFIGHEVEATIIKSKVNNPWRTAKFKLFYPDPEEAKNEVEPAF
jgi:RecA/RadA recombinase